MNDNDDPPLDPGAYEIGDFRDRAVTRIADVLVMTILYLG